MERSEIAYARTSGVAIAYQVVGDGPTDLVLVPDYVSNLVYAWESPQVRAFYERLASTFRLILFDKRGTGLSDHGSHFAALETRMDDLRAVLEAVGSERAVVLGSQEGCSMAALFAASYPERTQALVLFHPQLAPVIHDPGMAAELVELRERWGTTALADEILRDGAPSLYRDPVERRWFANYLRLGAGPEVAYALNRAFFESDLRPVLSAIHVPTLVLYRTNALVSDDDAREVAARIPDARLQRLSGSDYFELQQSPEAPDLIASFAAGGAAPGLPTSVLTTVVFTDLVGSTELAASLGDRAWRDVLAGHHAVVRRVLARFEGTERDTAGDGFFATFDGPARAIRAAEAIIAGLREIDLQARIGIHVGECEMHDGKPTGMAVNIGARVAAAAATGEVLVSRTVRDLVAGSGLSFEERGSHVLKGVPGAWDLYAVAPAS